MKTPSICLWVIWLLVLVGCAESEKPLLFPTGWVRSLTFDSPDPSFSPDKEEDAARAAIRSIYPSLPEDFSWKLRNSLVDATHTHLLFDLLYKGRRVSGRTARLHVRHYFGVQYFDGTLEKDFSLNLPSDTATALERSRHRAWQWLRKAGSRAEASRVSAEPIVWIEPSTFTPHAAIEVRADGYAPMQFRHYIEDETTGKVLETKRVARFADYPQNVYIVSPFANSNDAPMTSVNLPLISNASMLQNDYVYVRRQQQYPDTTACPGCLVDIAATADPSAFTKDPDTYAATCNGSGSTACPNQTFDGINIYYHITRFRQAVNTYFSQIGYTGTLTRDPVNVIINAFSENISGNGPSYESNNAAFINRPCIAADGDSTKNEACLVFLRPEHILNAHACSPVTDAKFYDVAREAIVAIHEYQHYITDTLAALEGNSDSSDGRYVVGDALHEGYSDYFAASEISYLNQTAPTGSPSNSPVTLVGQYAFQQCTSIQRDVSVLKVYNDNDDDSADPYVTSLSWSSGLWQLRSEFGRDVVNQLAIKSLLFLSSTPGFLQAVESLVRADESLFDGAHKARIRELYYNTIKFTGDQAGVFKDAANGVVELGFSSCLAARRGENHAPFIGAGVFLGWSLLIWAFGRVWVLRTRKKIGETGQE